MKFSDFFNPNFPVILGNVLGSQLLSGPKSDSLLHSFMCDPNAIIDGCLTHSQFLSLIPGDSFCYLSSKRSLISDFSDALSSSPFLIMISLSKIDSKLFDKFKSLLDSGLLNSRLFIYSSFPPSSLSHHIHSLDRFHFKFDLSYFDPNSYSLSYFRPDVVPNISQFKSLEPVFSKTALASISEHYVSLRKLNKLTSPRRVDCLKYHSMSYARLSKSSEVLPEHVSLALQDLRQVVWF